MARLVMRTLRPSACLLIIGRKRAKNVTPRKLSDRSCLYSLPLNSPTPRDYFTARNDLARNAEISDNPRLIVSKQIT